MLRTSVIAYPRIGEKRELKRLVERYLNSMLSETELREGSTDLKIRHWRLQKERGIDFISSNDFSFYDNFLDMAYSLNVIPERYKNLDLNDIDTYFAMAKGYQDKEDDVKALGMKKWFNTNYHYLVPEIEDKVEFKLNSDKLFKGYKEALELGIETKPVIIGPLTFLKLARIKSATKDYSDYIEDIVAAYKDILAIFNNLKAEMIQIDEPVIVTNLMAEDIDNFVKIYEQLLSEKGDLKVLLQTYFGDIRDIYNQVMDLAFDAVGLDFVEGKKSLDLIKKNGFPEDKLLFAGIINGKNVWRNNYRQTLELLEKVEAEVNKNRLVLNTSCSLLHVPHTLRYENNLDPEYKRQLAFAEEKLEELSEIKVLLLADDYSKRDSFINNQQLIEAKKNNNVFNFSDVKEEVENLKDVDFKRESTFNERIKKQHKVLNLPLLSTTTIGSFPQTGEIRKIRKAYKNNNLTLEEYKKEIKEKIKDVIILQEEIGLDVLVHGEFERNDMVEYFGENLEGFLFTENGWVQSYGTRAVKPPIIFGDVKRKEPITVEWITYAQSLTDKVVKGILTGPVTILNWSFAREDLKREEIVYQIALAIRKEVLDLERAGIKIIQVDEAALREKLPLRKEDWKDDYLDWAIKAFRLVTSSVKPETQIHTHMCYSEFSDIMEEIKGMEADVITFEAAKSDLSLLDVLQDNYEKEVGPGVYDIHSPRIPDENEFENMILKIIDKLDVEKIWVNPDCGLKTREWEETEASLRNMIKATKNVRRKLK